MYAPAAKAGVRRGEFNRPTGALKTPNAATSMQAVTMQINIHAVPQRRENKLSGGLL
jgi:hypothetical protein